MLCLVKVNGNEKIEKVNVVINLREKTTRACYTMAWYQNHKNAQRGGKLAKKKKERYSVGVYI